MTVPVLMAVSFALAFLTESTVEYVAGKPFDQFPKLTPHKWLLMYISLAVGVGLAFFYRLDMISAIAQVAGEPMAVSWVGFTLTGLGIGRGANYLHDFVSAYIIKPAARNSEAVK